MPATAYCWPTAHSRPVVKNNFAPFSHPPGRNPVVSITPITPGVTFSAAPSGGSPSLRDLPRPQDLALFFHTSGTTGRPKVSGRVGGCVG